MIESYGAPRRPSDLLVYRSQLLLSLSLRSPYEEN